jgi:YHS domain-containing protein
MVRDVVCGMSVDGKKAPKAVYRGREFYFCSESCKKTFEKNPEKYVK